ncbi:MAG: hypothetical protein JSW07_08430, partial [bacterium]
MAGSLFGVIITAKDQYNNTVTAFTDTASLSDLTGTISPTTTTNFITGVWNGSVQITKTHSNNKITVTAQNKAGTSSPFIIDPNSLDHFELDPIPMNQTAGNSFGITITAKDANDNTVTNFTGTASLSDLTVTIIPGITENFASGSWSGDVTITKSLTSNRISAASGSKTGTSNNFNVNPHVLDHFRFQTISSPRIARQSFGITITAEDIYNNRVISFSNTVTLSDVTNTI